MKLRNKKTGIVEYLLLNSYHVSGDIVLEYMDENAESGYSEYCRYSSLAELNADWEDYVPKEPLIKDKKIRKAVRAWADANGYGKDEVYEFEDFSTGWKSWSLEHKGNGDDNEIHFNGGIDFDKVEHQGYYTIDELCGEEEE